MIQNVLNPIEGIAIKSFHCDYFFGTCIYCYDVYRNDTACSTEEIIQILIQEVAVRKMSVFNKQTYNYKGHVYPSIMRYQVLESGNQIFVSIAKVNDIYIENFLLKNND